MSTSVDVTGLPPEAVRKVEQLVADLRAQSQSKATAGGVDPWAAAAEAARELSYYDFEAWKEQRAFDQHRGQDHLS